MPRRRTTFAVLAALAAALVATLSLPAIGNAQTSPSAAAHANANTANSGKAIT